MDITRSPLLCRPRLNTVKFKGAMYDILSLFLRRAKLRSTLGKPQNISLLR